MRKIGVFILILFFYCKLNAQEQSPTNSDVNKSLSAGLGLCNDVIYDASFSLVRQIGLGPSFHLAYYQSNNKETHIFENNIGIYRFHSDVPDPSYQLSGIHLHERFTYKYLRNYKLNRFILSPGPSFAFDFSQIKPEGLVINNAPLHDFNLQLQLAARVVYPIELFNRKWMLAYQLDLPVFGYNSRPDYLGFTEFSGDSKYFNSYGNFAFLGTKYWYIKNGIQLTFNYDKKNNYTIHLNQYYAQNDLVNTYQSLSNSVTVSYSRTFLNKQN